MRNISESIPNGHRFCWTPECLAVRACARYLLAKGARVLVLNPSSMRAVIIAAVTSAEGSAQVIARAPDVILFGRCHAEAASAKVYWFRAMLKDGTTRAVSSSSMKCGREDPPEVPASVASLLTGETPTFVAPGDAFELELTDLEDRRATVRMSQADFTALMRSLLDA